MCVQGENCLEHVIIIHIILGLDFLFCGYLEGSIPGMLSEKRREGARLDVAQNMNWQKFLGAIG